jgi:hypothetical protein
MSVLKASPAREGLFPMLIAASPLIMAALATSPPVGPDCAYNGIPLQGRVQVVSSFPDIKVELVSSFPDIRVQQVTSFPDSCGRWQFVDSFPDFTVQFVTSFSDIRVEYVTSFLGVR